MSNDLAEFKLARLKQIRRIILELLDLVGIGAVESVIIQVLNSRKLTVTPFELQRELDYLAQRGVIKLDRQKQWFATLTPDGSDLITGITPTPDWIAAE
jgi:hypothetical protein